MGYTILIIPGKKAVFSGLSYFIRKQPENTVQIPLDTRKAKSVIICLMGFTISVKYDIIAVTKSIAVKGAESICKTNR